MGIRGRKLKPVDERLIHHNSNLFIEMIRICEKCPAKLYTKEKTITYGIGNVYGKFIIVLNYYDLQDLDNQNNKLNILINQYKEITGKDLLEDAYITRLCKCYNSTMSDDILNTSYNNCDNLTIHESLRSKSKIIIFCGDTYNYFKKKIIDLDYDLNLIDILKTTRLEYRKIVYNLYDPICTLYEGKNKDKFIKDFTKIINDNI